jgi:hypothetical protein
MNSLMTIWRQVRRNARDEDNHGVLVQLLEILALRALHGIGPNYYLMAGFASRSLPWQLKATHRSAAAYHRWLAEVNPPAYRKISQNKLAEKALLRLMHIPATELLGYFHPRQGVDGTGAPLRSCGDFIALLEGIDDSSLVVKPLEGLGGAGVRVLDIDRSRTPLHLHDRSTGERFALTPGFDLHRAFFGPSDEGWLVERYFIQHRALAALNASSVNTIRMWVRRRDRSAPASCIGGYLRMGRQGSVVDNQSSGGLVCPVDNRSGVLAKAHRGIPERQLYARHPDSDAQIEGVALPYWEEARDLAARTLECFPGMYFGGLDIAIGPQGPVIVELNPSPDKEGAAFMQIAFPG